MNSAHKEKIRKLALDMGEFLDTRDNLDNPIIVCTLGKVLAVFAGEAVKNLPPEEREHFKDLLFLAINRSIDAIIRDYENQSEPA